MKSKFDPFLDATAQAELVRRGEVSPGDLVENAIEQIGRLNPQLNAVIHERFDKARAEAAHVSGPFRGVPYLIKDLTFSKGDLHAAGIAGVKAAGYRADHDAHLVSNLRKAGFVLVGAANTPELGLTATTEPVAFGPSRNPWNVGYSTGGSSGGSAAAVASGMVPVAHGSDGGGSVRMPSSLCGIVGLKPTRGRISSGPWIRDTDNVAGMSHEGLHTRSVRDLAAMLDAVDGARPGDAYRAPPPVRPFAKEVGADPGRLRIGLVDSDPIGQLTIHPECVKAVRAAAAALSELGHDLSPGCPEIMRKETWPQDFLPCVAVVVARELDHYGRLIGRPLTEEDVEFSTWNYATMGRAVTAAQYAAGIDAIRLQQREMERWWEEEGWDLLLTPTMPVLPPRIGEIQPTRENPFSTLAMSLSHFTVPFNVSGQPAITLPLHWTPDGFPVGVQLAAAYGRDDLLIRVAAQLEKAMPWADRRPPVAATR
jgi:amidase